LPPPSAEAERYLKPVSIAGFTGYFRLDAHKKLRDTQYALARAYSLAWGGPVAAPVAVDDRPPRQGVVQRPSHGQAQVKYRIWVIQPMSRTLWERFRL
jgi:hypothetical protein